ncbi:MAG: Xaa-Pro peptidase family protein [Desulfotignum sp.]|nr:Xaa-Pro peptidase family protein [Desulfotignum sp.]MCF8112606.1 Xaa-Pro peptidase family protein [Desulfotignum sp.]MCF8124946.1 Xaa-Pro peptidase family protein [Desulfotignum sp.]
MDQVKARHPFSSDELAARLFRVRQIMSENKLEAMLIFSPENIFYLTGLNHLGFFSPHILMVFRQGKMQLITRSMEAATVEAQLENIGFNGHSDSENPAQKAIQIIKKTKLTSAMIGIEKHTLFCPIHLWEALKDALSRVVWKDASYFVDHLRMVKSAAEISCIRQASKISAKMMQTVVATAGPGVSEGEIAAEVMRTMAVEGGEIPGFGPFIRARPSMSQEHVAWGDYRLKKKEMLFVELSGCCSRYHAPMGRLFFIGDIPGGTKKTARICNDAFDAVLETITPGKTADDAYQAWQMVIDRAGLPHYQRHHCGYMVGVGFPPSWVGGSRVMGLRRGSALVLEAGMTFHFLSWLVGSGLGDYLITDTVILNENGAEVLRHFPVTPQVI